MPVRLTIIWAVIGGAVGWLARQFLGELVNRATEALSASVRRLVRRIFRRESEDARVGPATHVIGTTIVGSSLGAQGGQGTAGGGGGGTGIGGPGGPGGHGGNIYLAPGSAEPPGASGGGGGGGVQLVVRDDGSIDLVGEPGAGGSGGSYLPDPDSDPPEEDPPSAQH
jgi:hypothetical protein